MKRRFFRLSLSTCSLFALFSIPLGSRSETSLGRMESISVSPDGKMIAVDFIKDKKSQIYLIDASDVSPGKSDSRKLGLDFSDFSLIRTTRAFRQSKIKEKR